MDDFGDRTRRVGRGGGKVRAREVRDSSDTTRARGRGACLPHQRGEVRRRGVGEAW